MIIVLGVADWPLYARVIRAETMANPGARVILAAARWHEPPRASSSARSCRTSSRDRRHRDAQVARVIILESFLSFLVWRAAATPALGNMLGKAASTCSTRGGSRPSPASPFRDHVAINLEGNALRDWARPAHEAVSAVSS